MKDPIQKILSEAVIQKRVHKLACEITQDFMGRELTVVGVLKGAFIFMADLVRQIRLPLRCDFLRIESYDAQGRRSSIRLEFDLTQPITHQEVLLVEDVLDSGHSLRFLLQHLSSKKPRSLNVCCLLDKGLSPELSKKIRYLGFEVPAKYLVGYGLDLNGLYRELPFVGTI